MPDSEDLFIDAYLREAALRLSPGTIRQRHGTLRRVSRAIGCPVIYATGDMLLAWRMGLPRQSDGSIANQIADLRQFFAWAITAGLRDDDPTVRLAAPRVPVRDPRPIAEDDLWRAMEAASPRVRPWLVLAGWCGMRCKEIALLRRDRVKEAGKRPMLYVAPDATKGYQGRWIPLCAFAASEIVPVLPRGRTAWVFTRRDGTRGPNSPNTVSREIVRLMQSLDIAATAHSLRHWFGTTLYGATRDLRLVQELMGHKDPRTTARYIQVARSAAELDMLPVPPRRRLAA